MNYLIEFIKWVAVTAFRLEPLQIEGFCGGDGEIPTPYGSPVPRSMSSTVQRGAICDVHGVAGSVLQYVH